MSALCNIITNFTVTNGHFRLSQILTETPQVGEESQQGRNYLNLGSDAFKEWSEKEFNQI